MTVDEFVESARLAGWEMTPEEIAEIPPEIKYIGTERPPEHVFKFFRELLGIPEPPPPDGSAV